MVRERESEHFIAAHVVTHPENVGAAISEGLTPEMFGGHVRTIMEVAFDLFREGALTSHNVVRTELQARGEWEEIGEKNWSKLVQLGWGEADLPYHMRRVKMRHEVLRHKMVMDAACKEIEEDHRDLDSKREAVRTATEDLLAIRAEDANHVYSTDDFAEMTLGALAGEYVNAYTETGLWSYDRAYGGLINARITCYGAKTNHGKSLFVDELARMCAMRFADDGSERQVVQFDLENGPVAANSRRMAAVSRLIQNGVKKERAEDILDGAWEGSQDEREALRKAAAMIRSLPWKVDCKAGIDAQYVHARTKAEHAKQPVGLITVDYIQIMGGTGDTQERIKQNLGGLHDLANDLDIPVVITSQTKIKNSSGGIVPRLEDLKWASEIAEVAATVGMLERPYQTWEEFDKQGEEPHPLELNFFIRKHKGRLKRYGLDGLKMDVDYMAIWDPEDPEYAASHAHAGGNYAPF